MTKTETNLPVWFAQTGRYRHAILVRSDRPGRAAEWAREAAIALGMGLGDGAHVRVRVDRSPRLATIVWYADEVLGQPSPTQSMVTAIGKAAERHVGLHAGWAGLPRRVGAISPAA